MILCTKNRVISLHARFQRGFTFSIRIMSIDTLAHTTSRYALRFLMPQCIQLLDPLGVHRQDKVLEKFSH